MDNLFCVRRYFCGKNKEGKKRACEFWKHEISKKKKTKNTGEAKSKYTHNSIHGLLLLA